jgi:phage terminase large subunit
MELETYRYPDKKADQNEPEKPIKENDHLLDALRYAIYTNQPTMPEPKDWIFEQRGTHYVD